MSGQVGYIDLGDGRWRQNDGCWRQFWDVGDGFGRFCHEHPLSFNISVAHQHPKCHLYRNAVTNSQKLSPTSNCHQHLCDSTDHTYSSTNGQNTTKCYHRQPKASSISFFWWRIIFWNMQNKIWFLFICACLDSSKDFTLNRNNITCRNTEYVTRFSWRRSRYGSATDEE